MSNNNVERNIPHALIQICFKSILNFKKKHPESQNNKIQNFYYISYNMHMHESMMLSSIFAREQFNVYLDEEN